MDRSFGVKAMIGIAIVASILFAAPTIGRFTPSHMILQEVYCGSCHPEQVSELSQTTHLGDFARGVNDTVVKIAKTNPALYGDTVQGIPAAQAITGGCTMCHNYWDNFKWFGVTNLTVTVQQVDNPAPITDIYGNTVSPYGTSSTQGYNVTFAEVVPWTAGLNVYGYTNATGTNFRRLDYMWSELSSISPGPAYVYITGSLGNGATFKDANGNTVQGSCGTAEKGMCHIARTAVAESIMGQRPEYQNATQPQVGAGVFFRHEMAYTTAQYAAKPVKLCGACHVFKLPPMTWGGEPWSQGVIEQASTDNVFMTNGTLNATNPNDPFGFTPNYAMVGNASALVSDWNYKVTSRTGPDTLGWENVTGKNQFSVAYKTPDWAHQNVPCMRCHVHAGINGVTVSTNPSGRGP